MQYKSSTLTDIKVMDEAQGIVEAFTNTMGAIDADGDVIMPDAFDNSISYNMPVTVLQGHDSSKIIGKVLEAAPITVGDGEAKLWNKIQFNLETQIGREAFSNVSGGYAKEWSVGVNIPDGGAEFTQYNNSNVRMIKNVDWIEVSSVIRGASPDTQTISAKSEDKAAIPYRDTETTDTEWNGPRTVAAVPNDSNKSTLRRMFAYVDSDTDGEVKSDYKFPHHQWDGGVGAANLRACSAGIAALNGARGGTSIPESDRKGVYNHLRRHLESDDRDAPELLSAAQADEIMTSAEDRRRRRRQYNETIADEKATTDDHDWPDADDEVPLVTDAFVPSTQEQRDQIRAKLDEMRARQIGFRLRNKV